MKVVHLNYADRVGGAAIAAFRHNEAMQQCGIDSKMLVVNRTLHYNRTIITPTTSNLKLKIESLIKSRLPAMKVIHERPYATWSLASNGFDLSKHPTVRNADAIWLHWINGGMLSVAGIEKILKLMKPTYWFMHDMWPFTGGCHYALVCQGYEDKCGKCPFLHYPEGSKRTNDLSRRQMKKKLRRWSKFSNLHILAPSQWLVDCSQRSTLFGGLEHTVVRNVIDTGRFHPINKLAARRLFGLPIDKKLILFGADSISSPYKGWNYLKETLNIIDSTKIECIVFGTAEYMFTLQNSIRLKVHFTGKLSDEYSLIALYNACDVFVTASVAENYPNVLIEAMACGLPCVGFNTGGIPEIIRHGKTGYISQEISAKGLAAGINHVLQTADYASMSATSRERIVKENSYAAAKNAL